MNGKPTSCTGSSKDVSSLDIGSGKLNNSTLNNSSVSFRFTRKTVTVAWYVESRRAGTGVTRNASQPRSNRFHDSYVTYYGT
ncbi:hypothetical protein EVAR_45459_1 [Eumeta japonica]|uniref:Uncharacterized protein n=1 Tax=Eumeta variegata TaxID=151549 RepID=A0A4C1YKT7_EUMVA|nr:hypothetical protein EVAR_45459_1 [Eumeta japonica]